MRLLFSLLIFFIFSEQLYAFSCKQITAEETLEKYDVIIVGKVLSFKEITPAIQATKLTGIYGELEVLVDSAWKGAERNKKITIQLETSPYGEKHDSITLNQRYFFALDKGQKNILTLHPCSRYFNYDSNAQFIQDLTSYTRGSHGD